jgi:hypothetical protein
MGENNKTGLTKGDAVLLLSENEHRILTRLRREAERIGYGSMDVCLTVRSGEIMHGSLRDITVQL